MSQQRWLRIIPIATVMYAIAFINRTNISLALPDMSRELGMNSVQAGFIAGIFFFGYILLQIPGGYLASYWSTKRFVSILLIVWGVCALGCGLVHSWHELALMRFLLGVAEGGMYPATLILISHWFPKTERARANALFSIALPLSLVVSSPLSGLLIDQWNWRTMLVVEGLFPLVWVIVWVKGIYDYPRDAPWISTEERDYLEAIFQKDVQSRQPVTDEVYWRVLISPRALLLASIKLFMLSGQLGYLFWLPSAIEKAKHISHTIAGVLYAIPFIVGAASLIAVSAHSDRTGERPKHVAAPMIVGSVALFGGILLREQSSIFSYLMVCLAAIGAFAPLGPFWAIPTEMFSRKMAGSVAGLVNGIGNLGGLVGPILVGYLNKRTGSFVYGFGMLGVFMLIGAALTYTLALPSSRTNGSGFTAMA